MRVNFGEINMWKDVLKNVEFDPKESCCANLKNKWVKYVHDLADYYESVGVESDGLRNHDKIADKSCEELVAVVEEWANSEIPKESKMKPHHQQELKDILDEFKECMDEKEKNPALDNFSLFQDDPAGWMNQYIRNRRD